MHSLNRTENASLKVIIVHHIIDFMGNGYFLLTETRIIDYEQSH